MVVKKPQIIKFNDYAKKEIDKEAQLNVYYTAKAKIC